MRRLLLCAILAFPGSLPVLAGDSTKLRVVVTNQDGRPVDRANVIVRFSGKLDPKRRKKYHTTWELHSTLQGVAAIPEMPKGTVQIQVTAKGYQTFGQTFDVAEDERTIDVKLNPPQAQYSAH
jgi:hypothetical protein